MTDKASEQRKESPANERDYLFKLMGAYSASAKTFVALATATLTLTVTFREKVLGTHDGTDWAELPGMARLLLAGCWLALFSAIVSGSFYQYLAVKFVEKEVGGINVVPPVLRRYVEAPGNTYGVMLASFALGVLLFLARATMTLCK